MAGTEQRAVPAVREPRWGRGFGVLGALALAVVTLVWLVHPPADRPLGARAADFAPARPVRPVTGGAPDPRVDVRDSGTVPLAVAQAARSSISGVVTSVPDGAAAVAATDLSTGATVVQGSGRPIWTASLYKLLVLATLLRQHGPLSGDRLASARSMIEQSDNEAGYSLYQAAGGNPALQATCTAFGLTDSVVQGYEPAFTGLTAADAVRLVIAVARPGHLSAASRAQALGLMRGVVAGQRWGVSAAADHDTPVALKNGWLSVDDTNDGGQDDDGRWIVTSAGLITAHGHPVVVAALTEHGASYDRGVDDVETLARAAVRLLGD